MSYSDVTGHRSMVFDDVRNAAYARALAKVIRPGTVVMDLGAGLGVHGFSAARLGAASVHLVEPAPIIEVTRMLAAANGLANVHCHPCRVEELQLSSPVDVIVSVLTGNFLLTEDLLPSLFHARDRFLAPDGRMIPDRARMEIVPVNAPDYYGRHVDIWSDKLQVDYRAARPFAANTLYYDARESFGSTPLAAPSVLMELDFMVAKRADCDSETEVEVLHSGTCHGWLGWFQMNLGDEWLSTSGETELTHWSTAFLPLQEPLEVRAGDRLGFALKRPEFGEWTWTTRSSDGLQRQSTFLSQPLPTARLKKGSEKNRPALNLRGEAALWLLEHAVSQLSIAELAVGVYAQYPRAFTSPAEALQFVQDLIAEFC